jgi:hypothetical protein
MPSPSFSLRRELTVFAAALTACAAACANGNPPMGFDPADAGTDVIDAAPAADAMEAATALGTVCPQGTTTTLSGIVYDPAGLDPLYDVIVYVPSSGLTPFSDGATCDRCDGTVSGASAAIATTDAAGHFSLSGVPYGQDVPLVMQIGRWRRQVAIPTVTPCQPNAIDDAQLLRLPRNKAEGDIPKMAIATGSADPMECLLRKIGIDDSEFTTPSGNGRIHVYQTVGGATLPQPTPTAEQLWSDPTVLERYDTVLLPCEGDESPAEKTPAARQALVDYTSAGGRLFVSHFGYMWIGQGAAPFPTSGTWDTQHPGDLGDPVASTIDTSFPKGAALAQWLVNVGVTPTAGQIPLFEPRHDLDSDAPPLSQAWIRATGTTGPAVQHMTFNTPMGASPDNQCGRVVYSDFHVSTNERIAGYPFPMSCASGALTGQEKLLEFMLFDLSDCIAPDQPNQ